MKIGLFNKASKYLKKANTFGYASRYFYGGVDSLFDPMKSKRYPYIQALYREDILTAQQIDLMQQEGAIHFFENSNIYKLLKKGYLTFKQLMACTKDRFDYGLFPSTPYQYLVDELQDDSVCNLILKNYLSVEELFHKYFKSGNNQDLLHRSPYRSKNIIHFLEAGWITMEEVKEMFALPDNKFHPHYPFSDKIWYIDINALKENAFLQGQFLYYRKTLLNLLLKKYLESNTKNEDHVRNYITKYLNIYSIPANSFRDEANIIVDAALSQKDDLSNLVQILINRKVKQLGLVPSPALSESMEFENLLNSSAHKTFYSSLKTGDLPSLLKLEKSLSKKQLQSLLTLSDPSPVYLAIEQGNTKVLDWIKVKTADFNINILDFAEKIDLKTSKEKILENDIDSCISYRGF